MLYEVTDDTLISAQSLPTNTNFQTLSNPERKPKNNVSSQFVASKWIGIMNRMEHLAIAKKKSCRKTCNLQSKKCIGECVSISCKTSFTV